MIHANSSYTIHNITFSCFHLRHNQTQCQFKLLSAICIPIKIINNNELPRKKKHKVAVASKVVETRECIIFYWNYQKKKEKTFVTKCAWYSDWIFLLLVFLRIYFITILDCKMKNIRSTCFKIWWNITSLESWI